jgi:hypothetical protein
MGAYYEATIDGIRFDTHSMDNGLKLMEHSYLENDYCIAMEVILSEEPAEVIWLCDYHEPDGRTQRTWENTNELGVNNETKDSVEDFKTKERFIINLDKKAYFSTKELMELSENENDWVIHPLPLLTNSDTESSGGGDYHEELSWRADWCEDKITVCFERPENMNNISKDVFLVESW